MMNEELMLQSLISIIEELEEDRDTETLERADMPDQNCYAAGYCTGKLQVIKVILPKLKEILE